MSRRLALDADGNLTFCTAPPERIGMGRCTHVEHQGANENKQSFMDRISNFSTGGNNNQSNGFVNKSPNGSRKPRRPNKNSMMAAVAIIALGLGYEALNGDGNKLDSFIGDAKTEVQSKLNLHDKNKTVAKPKDNAEIRSEIKELTENIEIAERREIPYDRNSWGEPFKFEYTVNGQKMTTDSIRKAGIYKSAWYNPEKEEYKDPYTNGIITDFSKWSGSGALQFDHIIPLNYVNSQVGDKWSSEEKREYAYDINIGVNADASLNGAKSDKGPAGFLPPENQAAYCYSWLVIADEYDISISQEDMNVIQNVLNSSDPEDIVIINPYDK